MHGHYFSVCRCQCAECTKNQRPLEPWAADAERVIFQRSLEAEVGSGNGMQTVQLDFKLGRQVGVRIALKVLLPEKPTRRSPSNPKFWPPTKRNA
jgi:hypothetical protein